jgi:hypothetical protein
MIQKFIRSSLAIMAFFSIVVPLGQTAGAAPAPAVDSRTAICESLGTKDCSDPAGSGSLASVVQAVIRVLSIIIGIAAVIMIIFAGLRYITSGGDATKISSAKDTIIYAVIGLVIVALAQIIVKFVLTKAT